METALYSELNPISESEISFATIQSQYFIFFFSVANFKISFVSAAKPTTNLGLCELCFDRNSNISIFLLRFKFKVFFLIFFVSYFYGLKSLIAAEHTAISTGNNFLVSLYI